MRSHPRYLDLPAYDAVRCPSPDTPSGLPPGRSAVLVLCPFQKKYKANWRKISDFLGYKFPKQKIVRMLDIASPRLVGQALYEHIRWAKTCVVDWSFWRANLFFELGVRVACSDIAPICLIENSHLAASLSDELTQRAKLQRLFGVLEYNLQKPVDESLGASFDARIAAKGAVRAIPREQLAHDATYRLVIDAFDWRQEYITLKPNELLRLSAEAEIGKDPQMVGASPVLFSMNPEFSQHLRRSIQERWIAAWYYVCNRHSEQELLTDNALREELKAVGETTLQWIPHPSGDQRLESLRSEIVDWIDKLD